jgi:hypothetical protein
MGTVNAILLFAEPITTWVNARFLWMTSSWGNSKRSISLNPGDLLPSLLQRGEFPASRGVLSLTHAEKAGGNEVKL